MADGFFAKQRNGAAGIEPWIRFGNSRSVVQFFNIDQVPALLPMLELTASLFANRKGQED